MITTFQEKAHPGFYFIDALFKNNPDDPRIEYYPGNHRCKYSPGKNTEFWDWYYVSNEIANLYDKIFELFHPVDDNAYDEIKKDSAVVELVRSVDLQPLRKDDWDPYGFRADDMKKYRKMISEGPSWIQRYNRQAKRVKMARSMIKNLGLNPGHMFESTRDYIWCF